jgi:hypothetical protein
MQIPGSEIFLILNPGSGVEKFPGSGVEKFPGSGMEKFGSGINIPDPQHRSAVTSQEKKD